jgi:tRNA (guanine37-N1)-methyltransferase
VRLDVFTLFPAAFDWYVTQVHVRKALDLGHELTLWNYRDHTPLSHLQVDDTPYGGGAGMVLRIDVVAAALEAAFGVSAVQVRDERRVVELTPKGRQFDDRMAEELAGGDLVLLCGRYEGIDERVAHFVSDRVSIGPYVLSGGEVAAMAVTDAVLRKLPGVISNPESVVDESFAPGLEGGTEYPQYTRPAEFRGWAVPDVLRSGDHARIARWRHAQALHRTLQARPDLIEARGGLTDDERALLAEHLPVAYP